MKSHSHKVATLRATFGTPCLVSLHAGAPGAELHEVSYPNYQPVKATFAVVDQQDPPVAFNLERIIFEECENASVLVTHVGVRNEGENDVRYYGELPGPVPIGNMIRPEFEAGSIRITEY